MVPKLAKSEKKLTQIEFSYLDDSCHVKAITNWGCHSGSKYGSFSQSFAGRHFFLCLLIFKSSKKVFVFFNRQSAAQFPVRTGLNNQLTKFSASSLQITRI